MLFYDRRGSLHPSFVSRLFHLESAATYCLRFFFLDLPLPSLFIIMVVFLSYNWWLPDSCNQSLLGKVISDVGWSFPLMFICMYIKCDSQNFSKMGNRSEARTLVRWTQPQKPLKFVPNSINFPAPYKIPLWPRMKK